MGLSDALKKASNSILKSVGGNVTLRQIAVGSYNTTDGTIAETVTDTVIKGSLENVSKSEVNDLIRANDKKLTISAQGLSSDPTPQDRILISSIEYQIIQVLKYEQNNSAITFELILRE